MEGLAILYTPRRRPIGAVLLGAVLLVATALARAAAADTLLATGDALPGLGIVQEIIPQVCVSPDGGILTTVRGEDGRSAFVCSDGTGSRVVLRSGDPEPTGRVFSDLQYGSCSFMRDGQVIFSASTLRPVVGSDGQVQHWLEAAIYRAGPNGITRVFGTGDSTSVGPIELFSSVRYSVSSAGTVLASAFAGNLEEFWGGDHWFLVRDSGIELAYDGLPSWLDDGGQAVHAGVPALTTRGEFVALGVIPELSDGDRGANALIEWTTVPGRVVVTNRDLASDGFPYGEIRSGWQSSRDGNPLSIRNDTVVFAARVGLPDSQYQTRFFRYTAAGAAPQLVFAQAPETTSFQDSWVIDSNTNGDILLFDGTQTMHVARAGQPLQSIHRDLGACSEILCPGIEPVGLSDDGVVFSIVAKVSPPATYAPVTLETDLGTAAGTSCSLLPTLPVDVSPTATASRVPADPTPTETAIPASPDSTAPPNPVCVGDCDGDRVVTVGELTTGVKILLGSMPMSTCPACEPPSGAAMSVDVIIRAVDAALAGCP